MYFVIANVRYDLHRAALKKHRDMLRFCEVLDINSLLELNYNSRASLTFEYMHAVTSTNNPARFPSKLTHTISESHVCKRQTLA